MKRFLTIIILTLVPLALMAQEFTTDTLSLADAVDSTLVGKDVLSIIKTSGTSRVNQSAAMASALSRYISANAASSKAGYRIRVYYDSQQSSRGVSDAIAKSISNDYPDVRVYRTYENPNFKVTVGDFRTKDEAIKVFTELKAIYPGAFLIRDNINYPTN